MMQISLYDSQASSGNENKEYDRLCKIVLLGESDTGKTSNLKTVQSKESVTLAGYKPVTVTCR